MDNIRKRVDPKHFQVFHLLNIEDSPMEEVFEFLSLDRLRVYLINHRVKKLVAREVQRLSKEII